MRPVIHSHVQDGIYSIRVLLYSIPLLLTSYSSYYIYPNHMKTSALIMHDCI